MRAVWKFPLARGAGEQRVRMPAGAQVTHVGVQNGHPCMWAIVRLADDGSSTDEDRAFCLVNTGDPIRDGFRIYRGTMTDPNSGGVWHLFEWQDTGSRDTGGDLRGGPVP